MLIVQLSFNFIPNVNLVETLDGFIPNLNLNPNLHPNLNPNPKLNLLMWP